MPVLYRRRFGRSVTQVTRHSLFQQCVLDAVEIGRFHDAHFGLDDPAVAVDEQRVGEDAFGVAQGLHQRKAFFLGNKDRVAHLVGLGEVLGRFGFVFDADAEHLDLAFVGGAEFDQFGDFGAAGGAPARPEIDDQRLAPVTFQRHGLVVEIVERSGEQRG